MAEAAAGPSTFDEVRRLFDALWGLRASEWEHALKGRSTRVREQVLGLLEADRVASQVLATRGGRAGLELLASDLAAEPDPEALGDYRILRRFGTGAMGVVYEAEQAHPRRAVALKVLHPWLRSAGAVELFRFEAQALGQVSHPCIPVVYEAGEQDGVAYLSMEPVRGVDLATWHRRERPDTPRVLRILARVADAVHAAHEAGLLHRDLKPGNVVVVDGDVPKLLDFGVAMPLLAREPGMQPGTPLYMSPEQVRGEPLDRRSDVHALGTMAFELLTGRPPVSDRSLSEVLAAKGRPPPRASEVDPSLDDDLDHVLARALALDPAQRCPDAATFAADLRAVADVRPLPWRTGGLPYRMGRFGKRHRRALWVAAAVAGTLALTTTAVAVARQVEVQRLDARVQQRAARIDALLADARSDAQRADALAAVDAFVADPEHQGHPATHRVWLSAARLHPEGSRAHLDALAAAYRSAVDADGVARVQVALGEAFHATSDWEALEQLETGLLPEAQEALRDVLRAARIARRDVRGALALDDGRHGWIRFLGEATFLGTDRRAMWFDAVGDPQPELLFGDHTQVRSPLGQPRHGTLDGPQGVSGLGAFARDGDAVVDAVRVGRRTLLRRFTPPEQPGPDTPWEHTIVAELDGFGVQDLARARTSAGPRWVVASSYPLRDALLVSDDGTVEGLLDAPIGSDVRSVDVRDLDGDGVDEIVLGVASWASYAAQVYRDDGTGYRLDAERVLGTVAHAIVIDGPDGPLVVAAKTDDEADPRFFGSEQPFGPDPGLYVLDPAEDLAIQRFLPIPVADHAESTPARGMGGLRATDLDGDGRLDLVSTLQFLDQRSDHVLWLVHDLLGDTTQAWVAGLDGYGVGDVDGDGADELMVQDDTYGLWALGVGDEELPAWVATPSGRLTIQPAPPGLDEARVRDWERARALASLGLTLPAVEALDQLAARLGTGEASAAHQRAAALVHRVTGDLLDRSGRPGLAAARHLRAHELGDDEAEGDAVRSYAEALRWEDALALGAPSDLPFPADLPTVDLLGHEAMRTWQLAIPGAVRHGPDGLYLDAMNDMGALLEVPVEVVGDAVSLTMELRLDEVELGSGLSVELVSETTGETPLGVRLWGQGGGGNVKVRRHCFGPEERELGHNLYAPQMRIRPVAARFPDGRLRCGYESHIGAPLWADHAMEPMAPGPYVLRIRAAGDAGYSPPSRLQAQLAALRLVGVRLRDVPVPPEAKSRAAWMAGDLGGDVAAADRAWRSIAAGDRASLGDDLASLIRSGDTRRVGWLLRQHPVDVVPLLEELLGPDFAPTFHEVMDIDSRGRQPTAAHRDALLLPHLASLPASDPSGRQVRLWRARIRMERGERARARQLAQSIVEADGDHDRQRGEALLLLAELATTEEEREAHVARALAISPDRTLHRRVVRPPSGMR